MFFITTALVPQELVIAPIVVRKMYDISSTCVVTKKDGCSAGGTYKEVMTHVHECIAHAANFAALAACDRLTRTV